MRCLAAGGDTRDTGSVSPQESQPDKSKTQREKKKNNFFSDYF